MREVAASTAVRDVAIAAVIVVAIIADMSSSSDGLRVCSLLPLFPPRRGLAITWCPTLGAPDAAWSLK